MAGVNAARTLQEEGITNFVILEGRDEIGGRVRSRQFGDLIINTGLQWVRLAGEDSHNPL